VREISLHILDLLENAVEAGASKIEIRIEEDMKADRLMIEISDNGCGMKDALIGRVLDPFCTTRKTRHVGLGLPLALESARRCEGNLEIQSEPGKGTRVRVTFRHSHIDRAPLGDMSTALLAILLSERSVDLDYCHRVNSREFRFDSSEVRRELEDIPLTHPRVRDWLFQLLHEGESCLFQEWQERQPALQP
jgi:anti-sigma regulatory factor (Ser/Thr protein kinase)